MEKVIITIFIMAIITSALLCFSAETGAERYALDAVEKGWNYFRNGDLETALKRFHQAKILDPNFAPGYY